MFFVARNQTQDQAILSIFLMKATGFLDFHNHVIQGKCFVIISKYKYVWVKARAIFAMLPRPAQADYD